MKKNIISLLALVCAMVWTGCSEVEEPFKEEQPEAVATTRWSLTLQAAKGADTKALYEDNNALLAYWTTNDKVKVYKGQDCIGTLSVQPSGEKSASATLSGELNVSNLQEKDVLTLLIPGAGTDFNWTYEGQTGAFLGSENVLESPYDYAMATVSVAGLTPGEKGKGTVSIDGTAEFKVQQRVFLFGFKDGQNTVTVKTFELSSANGKLVRTVGYDQDGWKATSWGSLSITPVSETADLLAIFLRNDYEIPTEGSEALTFSVIGREGSETTKWLYSGTKSVPGTITSNYIKARNVAIEKVKVAEQQGQSGEAF